MNLKSRCCCNAPNVEVQFIEVEPVIDLPSDAQLVGNVSWWLDLGSVVELNPDTVIYPGGQASTFGLEIEYGQNFVFVPAPATPAIWWPDGDITANNNLADIHSLPHRGWKKKQPARQVTFEQLAEIDGTRIVWNGPIGVSDDNIDQLNEGGFYFIDASLFNQTPALVVSRTSTDYGGDSIGYTVGYNPRKECVKPEQGRYYGASHTKLMFDFTAQFPESITLKYTFPELDGNDDDVVVTKTYSKFVLGGETSPTTEFLVLDAFGQGAFVVTGFDDEDPENSDLIKFGYRTSAEPYEVYDLNPSSQRVAQVPSIPFFWTSPGSDETVGTGDFKAGEGSTGMVSVASGFSQTTHKLVVGDVMQDITYYPESAELTGEQKPKLKRPSVGVLFPDGTPFPFRTNDSPSLPVIEYQCASYKGAVAIDDNLTFSLRDAYPVDGAESGTLYLTSQFATNNDGVRNPISIPTFAFPALAWSTNPQTLRLEKMSNPILGANHPLSRSNFTSLITADGLFARFNTPTIELL